jgi:Family of unknown function (DUF5681)
MTDTTPKPVDPRALAKSAVVVAVPKVDGQKLVMRMPVQAKPVEAPKVETPRQQMTATDTKPVAPVVVSEVKKIVPEVSPEQKEQQEQRDKPVIGRPFPPGVSGNPAGRPPKRATIDTAIQEELDKAHAITAEGVTLTKNQMIAKKMVEKAVEGDIKAAVFVAERSEGKAMQKIQVVAPEDASGTVISKEAEERLDELFGRK